MSMKTGGRADVAFGNWTYLAQYWKNVPGVIYESGIRTNDIEAVYFQNNTPTNQFSYTAQHWSAGPKAGVNFTGGTATVKCSYHSYVASGNVRVSGGTSSQVVHRVIPPTSAAISTGGTTHHKRVYTYLPAAAAVTLAGSATVISSLRHIYNANGGVVAGGTTGLEVVRPTYVSGGTIRTGGSSQPLYTYAASGGLSFTESTAHAACSYHSYGAEPASLSLYTPSYYELIDHLEPIGFWVLDETSGTTLPNYGTSGSGNYAQLSGSPVFQQPSWIPNQLDGYSMRFDWLDTVAVVTGGPEYFVNTAARSVSMVFRLYDVTARSCLYDEGSSISGMNLSVVNGNLIFHVFHMDPPVLDSASLSVAISANQNYHVAAVADATSNTMKLYLNGVLVGSQAMYATPVTTIPVRDSLAFGAKAVGTRYNDTNGGFLASSPSPSGGHWTRGDIQAVAVWDRAISQTEVELQQNARPARYTSSVQDIHNYQPAGGVVVGGTAAVVKWASYWTYDAVGTVATGGTSVSSQSTTDFSVVASPVGPRFAGAAGVVYNRYVWLSDVAMVVPASTTSVSQTLPAFQASGSATFGGTSVGLSSNYEYAATGGMVGSGGFEVGTFTLETQPTGGMVLASVATEPILTFVYNSFGGMTLQPFGKFDYTLEVERNITWNISRGVLRYYRVEGKPRPNNCPPISGVCGTDQCVQYVINVSAHSASEVCDQLRKLRFKGPVKRISVMSRPVLKTDEDPNVNYDCTEFVDVEIPVCDDLFLEYDVVVTAGATAYAVFTEDFAYFPSGRISSSGAADRIFNQWGYVASGGIAVSSEETDSSFPGLVFVEAVGGAVFGGEATYSTNALGTQLATAGATPVVLFIEAVFGAQSGGVLSLPDETVETTCCGNLPSLLHMSHQIERFAKLDKFLFINDLSVRRNLRLVYSAKKNIWYNNLHFKGTGSSNDPETWDITSEFGCVDDLDGIPIQGTLWGFSFTVCNRNLRTRSDNYTRIVLGFDPTLICTLDEAIDNIFTVNVRDQSTDPVALRPVVLYDEIGLFKNRAFINDPNIKFRVTSTPIATPLSNINLTNSLQELLL